MAPDTNSNHGVTGGLQNASLGLNMALASFCAICLTNALEVIALAWWSFRKRKGLYFWTINASALGTVLYAVGCILKFYALVDPIVIGAIIILLGWVPMVTGQSLVMYSRLHLITTDPKKGRWILWMIIFNGIVFHSSTSALMIGSNSTNPKPFVFPYSVVEKIQVTVFFLQEVTISAFYIQQTRKIMRPSEIYQRSRVQRVMRHLIYVNVLIILMDICLLGTEYANLYEVQVLMKGAIYAVKLRLEFSILNQLIDTLRNRGSSYENGSSSNGRSGGGANGTRLATLHTHKSVHGAQPTGNRHYSVYVGKSSRDQGNEAPLHATHLEDGTISRTTEVTVHTSELDDARTDASGLSQPASVLGPQFRSKSKTAGSISSSEIELARAGG